MKQLNKRRVILSHRLTRVMLLSVLLVCSPTYSASPDFSYMKVSHTNSPKLINPLYLDSSKLSKPTLKINTSSFKGEFDESDYFSSSIDNEEEIENTQETTNNFFTPPEETTVKKEDQSPKQNNLQEVTQENTYCAGVDTNGNDLNLEGLLISDIKITGLNTIKTPTILSAIKTQSGSLFNSSILQQDLQNIYNLGYFSDNMSIEPILNSDNTITLVFAVEENILVSDVQISGNTVISSTELNPLIEEIKGKPQNINTINQVIDKINSYYHEKGYILAQVNSVDDDSDGNLKLGITEGVINKIIIEGNEKTKDYVIERNIITQPGTIYNENYLKEDLSRIYSTQIFDDVERKIEPSCVVKGEYDIKVIVKEQSTNSLALGGGIDNALGAFGSVGIKENNFLGKGQQLSLSGILGSGILLSDASIKNRMNYQIELSFFEPYFLNADNSLASKLYYRDLGSYQVPLAIEKRIGFNTVVEHKVRNHKNLSTSLGTGIEYINLKEGDFSKISSLYAANNLDIAKRSKQLTDGLFFNFAPGIKYSNLDSEENPRNGYIAQAKFIESFGLSDFSNTSGRLAGSVTKYYPVKSKSSFSLTARGGTRIHGNDMPEVMAFRLGGPYSIRGFKMNGVGTGDAFIMGSAELATPLPFVDRLKFDTLKKMRLTFFVDAGQIFDPTISSELYDRPLSAISAGVGLKVYIPGLGPISVDYGLPLTNTGKYGSSGGYFTFGSSAMYGYGW